MCIFDMFSVFISVMILCTVNSFHPLGMWASCVLLLF